MRIRLKSYEAGVSLACLKGSSFSGQVGKMVIKCGWQADLVGLLNYER